jgi:hypothetical protein
MLDIGSKWRENRSWKQMLLKNCPYSLQAVCQPGEALERALPVEPSGLFGDVV